MPSYILNGIALTRSMPMRTFESLPRRPQYRHPCGPTAQPSSHRAAKTLHLRKRVRAADALSGSCGRRVQLVGIRDWSGARLREPDQWITILRTQKCPSDRTQLRGP